MQASLKVVDLSAVTALAAWARQRELRGKPLEDSLRKIMRYWVESALANIPHGDREKVGSYLRAQVAATSLARPQGTPTTKAGVKAAARANALRGSRAARIVAALNIYQARGLKAAAFYAKVNKWMNSQIFSVNIHPAGLLPARRLLKLADRRGPMPRIKNAPGSITESLTDDLASIVVENWASSHNGDGIAALAGDAFTLGLAQTENRIAAWVQEKMEASARTAGLNIN